MKVFQVLNHFLPNQTAGTEIYTWALSKCLQNLGISVKVIVPHFNSELNYSYYYDSIQVYEFAEPSKIDKDLIMGFREPDGLQSFIQFLENEKPDIVHFHSITGSNGIGIKHVEAAKNLKIKVILTIHLASFSCKTGVLIDDNNQNCDGKILIKKCSKCYLKQKGLRSSRFTLSFLSKLLYDFNINTLKWRNSLGTALGTATLIKNHEENFHKLFNICDQIVCITEWYKKILLLNGFDENKIKFIEQGLPVKTAPNIKNIIKNKLNTPLKLMFLGRVTKIKGLHLLIDVILNINPNLVRLDIYGQGDDTNFEISLKNKTKLMDNIRWYGVIGQHEVQKVMQEHDLLCLCSTICEMSPLVIQEARHVNLPVLASDVYGNLEQLKDGKGFIFKTNNFNSLYSQLVSIIHNRDLLLEIKNKIQPPLDFEKVGKMYYELYQKVTLI